MKNKFSLTNSNNIKIFYVISFVMPAFICFICSLQAGIFTQDAIIINDLHKQYANFLSYYRNSMFENGVFYSFSKDLGGNFYGILTYYLMSPINLISFLFKPENLEYAIMTIILIKTGLSGLTSFLFLSKQHAKVDVLTLACSLCYSLSSCFVVWNYHIIWSDAFYMLPLIMLGTQKILAFKSSKLFVVSFSLMLIINYYMAYIIGIFVVIYFIYNTIANTKSKKMFFKQLFLMAKSAVICIFLSAWVLIPTFFSLLQGKVHFNANNGLDVGLRVLNIFALAPKFFISGYDGLGSVSTPYIYSSALVIVLVIAYFFIKNISFKEKIATLFVLIILMLSAIFRPLFLLFHMLSVPNSFPYRFIFVLSFFLIYTAYKAVRNYNNLNYKLFLPASVLYAVILLLLVYIYPYKISYLNIFSTFALCAVFIVSLKLYVKKPYMQIIVFLVVCFDLAFNTFGLINGNYDFLEREKKNEFHDTYLHTSELLNKIENEEFYRIANVDEEKFINNGFKYGFNNYYNSFSSLPEINSDYIKENYIETSQNDKLTKALFNVKYEFNGDSLSSEMDAFPLIFTADELIFNKDNSNIQNFVFNLYGINFVDDDGELNSNFNNVIEIANENIENLTYSNNKISVSITAQNSQTYALSTIIYDESWSVKVNNKTVDTTKILENLLAFPLEEGENKVELTYIPKGLKLGVFVSMVMFFAIIIFFVVCKKRKNKQLNV